ncbi:hypothetical protein WDV06_04585 [Streptomyces racemochromogenes]|uniref:Uncharacterized protein n=1 Tax=Streptomyces racemochromogenes TaxID=67353 RepID=A0ABW7P7R4_9ACTN
MNLTPHELPGDLYGRDEDAHFDAAPLREGLAHRMPRARLDAHWPWKS